MRMRKLTILSLLLALLLCACAGGGGETTASQETDAPTQTTAPAETDAPTETDAPSETTDPAQALKELAESYIGKTLQELIDQIGEPETYDYAPSCLGDGEDGNLYYDGFIVYTYRTETEEIIQYVE